MNVVHYLFTAVEDLGHSPASYVEQNLSPRHATNETLRRLAAEKGWHVEIHAPTRSRKPYDAERGGIGFHAHPIRCPWLARLLPRVYRPTQLCSTHLIRALDAAPIDLFVFYGVASSVFLFSLANRLRARGVPYIATVTGRTCRRNGIVRGLLDGAEAVVVRCEATRAALGECFGLSAERCHVIPNGVNTDLFFPDRRAPVGREARLCFVGRLTPEKGFLDALECVASLKDAGMPAVMEVAGEYVDEGFRSTCEKFMRERGIERSVELHGWLDAALLSKVYNRADLLLFPSHSEGLSRTVLEAMACETPAAVVAASGGHAEIVDATCGVKADRGDFPEAVREALVDRVALRRRGEAARRRILTGLSLDVTRKRIAQLYARFDPASGGKGK